MEVWACCCFHWLGLIDPGGIGWQAKNEVRAGEALQQATMKMLVSPCKQPHHLVVPSTLYAPSNFKETGTICKGLCRVWLNRSHSPSPAEWYGVVEYMWQSCWMSMLLKCHRWLECNWLGILKQKNHCATKTCATVWAFWSWIGMVMEYLLMSSVMTSTFSTSFEDGSRVVINCNYHINSGWQQVAYEAGSQGMAGSINYTNNRTIRCQDG